MGENDDSNALLVSDAMRRCWDAYYFHPLLFIAPLLLELGRWTHYPHTLTRHLLCHFVLLCCMFVLCFSNQLLQGAAPIVKNFASLHSVCAQT